MVTGLLDFTSTDSFLPQVFKFVLIKDFHVNSSTALLIVTNNQLFSCLKRNKLQLAQAKCG